MVLIYKKYRELKKDGSVSDLIWYKNDEYRRTHQLCPKCNSYGYIIHKFGNTGEHNNRCMCCGYTDSLIFNIDQVKDYILIKDKIEYKQESAKGYIGLLIEEDDVFKIVLKKYVNPEEIDKLDFETKYKGFSLILCNPVEHQIEIVAGKMKGTIIKMVDDVWVFTSFEEEKRRIRMEEEKKEKAKRRKEERDREKKLKKNKK